MTDPLNATMRREIEAQPSYFNAALSPLRASALAAVQRVSGGRSEGLRIWAGGCGDSYFAAVALSELFRELGVDYAPVTAQDIASYPRVSVGDVVVLISISGSTRRTLDAARTATGLGAHVIAITCKPDSALGQASDAVIELPYEPISRSTPHTLDYSMSLLALASLAEAWSGRLIALFAGLGDEMQAALEHADDAARVVANAAVTGTEGARDGDARTPRIFFLGAGSHRGTALYGAAKFYEAGGLPAFADETENFVHGMNFVVEPGDVACVIAPGAGDREQGASLIRGLSELGAHTLAIGFESVDADAGVDLEIEPTTTGEPQSAAVVGPAMWPFVEALPVQLLCLHMAIRLGLDVEKPRAGRPGAEVHARVQKAWMSGS